MAYVRQKQNSYGPYYQLVEAYRDGGKVRQRILVHLGKYPTVDEYLAGTREEIARLRGLAEAQRQKAEGIKHGLPERMRQEAQATENLLAAMFHKTPRQVRTPPINVDRWFSTPPSRRGSRSSRRYVRPYWWALERAGVFDRAADELEGRLERAVSVLRAPHENGRDGLR